MIRNMCKSGGLFLPVAFLVFGCATVNYIGNSFDPTTSVDMYFSEEEITQEYTVIGHALGSMLGWGSEDSEEIRAKLIEVAQLKGADAILITGIGKDNFFMGGSSSAEIQIDALFLKYK